MTQSMPNIELPKAEENKIILSETPATVAASLLVERHNEKTADDLDMEITSLKLKRNMEDYKMQRDMSQKKNAIEVNHQMMFFKNTYIEHISKMFSPSNKHMKAVLLQASSNGQNSLDIQIGAYRTRKILKLKKQHEMEKVGKTEEIKPPAFVYLPLLDLENNPFVEQTEEIKHTQIALMKAFANIEEHKGSSHVNSVLNYILNRVHSNVHELWIPLGIKMTKSYDSFLIFKKSKVCFNFKW
jgi:hypothetical protein